MSEDAALRIRDVATYLRVSHQRGTQMYAEGKLPKPQRIDGIGPLWKPATIERWAEREWCGGRGVGGSEPRVPRIHHASMSRMADLAEFLQRQDEAGRRLNAAFAAMASAVNQYEAQTRATTARVLSAPPGQGDRIAVEAMAPALAAVERAHREQIPEVLAVTAELSENWESHTALWDAATANQLPQAIDTRDTVRRMGDSARRAKVSITNLKRSLLGFASTSAKAARITKGTIQALDGADAALREIDGLAVEQLRTLERLIQRLSTTPPPKPGLDPGAS